MTQALSNAEGLLAGEGATLIRWSRRRCSLTDADEFPAVNEAYMAAFGGHRPARSMVAVSALPRGRPWRSSSGPHAPA